jgi:hypothetical protein
MKVKYQRAMELPDGARFQYEIKGEQVTVTVAADAACQETVEAAEEMWNEILAQRNMRRKIPLRLITGSG